MRLRVPSHGVPTPIVLTLPLLGAALGRSTRRAHLPRALHGQICSATQPLFYLHLMADVHLLARACDEHIVASVCRPRVLHCERPQALVVKKTEGTHVVVSAVAKMGQNGRACGGSDLG